MVSPVFTASVDSLLLSVLSLPLSWLFPPPDISGAAVISVISEGAAGVVVAEDVLFSLFPLWDDGAGVAVAEGVSSYPSVRDLFAHKRFASGDSERTEGVCAEHHGTSVYAGYDGLHRAVIQKMFDGIIIARVLPETVHTDIFGHREFHTLYCFSDPTVQTHRDLKILASFSLVNS